MTLDPLVSMQCANMPTERHSPPPVTKTGENDESFLQLGISGKNSRLFLILKRLYGFHLTHRCHCYFFPIPSNTVFILVSNIRKNGRNGCLISPYFESCLTSLVLSAKVRIKEILFGEAALQPFELY